MRRFAVLAIVLLAAGGALALARNARTTTDPVSLSAAIAVPAPDVAGDVLIYLTMQNGAIPNRLISAQSPDAAQVRVAGAVAGQVTLPGGSAPSLSGDGVYLQLVGFDGPMEPGRLVPISLEFEPSGTTTTRALLGATPDLHSVTMAEAMIDPPEGAPEISLSVSPAGDGWQVQIETDAFTFVPEVPDPVHVPGEGHGHLYLNGVKLQRMYDHSAQIGALPPGTYEVSVTLNSNTHLAYENDDGPIVARQTITVD